MPDEKPAETQTDEQKTHEAGKTLADATATALANAASKADVARIEQTVQALADTVRAAITRPPAQTQGGGAGADLPDHFVNLLRQQGLSDADIKHNAPIVTPFIRAMLMTDGQVMTGAIQQAADEVEMLKARGNKRAFPDWEHVEDRVEELRTE